MNSIFDFLISLDIQVLFLINGQWINPTLDQFFPAITDLHKTLAFKIIVPILFLTLSLKKYGKKGFAVFLGILLSLSLSDFLGTQLFKKNFQRPRPNVTLGSAVITRSPGAGYSFISNHAANMFCFATACLLFLGQRFIFMYFLAFVVAYSRIYNGVHYPSDVIAGALWGSLVAYVVFKIFHKIFLFQRNALQ
ncbi:MAG: phosphatase PAP2 family protein [Pseudobdellovibrionaceae bacterium]